MPHVDLQAVFDTMNKLDCNTRSKYHLTIKKAIDALAQMDQTLRVVFDIFPDDGPDNPHSYRGYYSDLALERSADPIVVEEFLAMMRKANGSTYVGWKGGDFHMVDSTPLWVSVEGDNSGIAIMGLEVRDGKCVILTKDTNA